jgi:galactokinase
MHLRATVPARVNIIEEHTDYSEGLALPFAIDEHFVLDVLE